MNFDGRWIPEEVMQTIFGLWGLIALLVFGAAYWMYRTRQLHHDRGKPLKAARRKHIRRKRRK